jgi:hypothetical protein
MTNQPSTIEALNGLLFFCRQEFADPDFAPFGSSARNDLDAQLESYFSVALLPDATAVFNQIATPLLTGERARYAATIAEMAAATRMIAPDVVDSQLAHATQLETSAVSLYKSALAQLKPTESLKLMERDAGGPCFSMALLQADIEYIDAVRPSLLSERQQVRSDKLRARVANSIAMLRDE